MACLRCASRCFSLTTKSLKSATRVVGPPFASSGPVTVVVGIGPAGVVEVEVAVEVGFIAWLAVVAFGETAPLPDLRAPGGTYAPGARTTAENLNKWHELRSQH